MNSYNGFDHAQRMKAFNWLKGEIAKGNRKPRPDLCDACGQTEAPLMWHSEDYSSPFGDHIGEHGLCYICHMMIHCRFKNKAKWEAYKEAINKGCTFWSYGSQNWTAFKREFLESDKLPDTFWLGNIPRRRLLDVIDGTIVE